MPERMPPPSSDFRNIARTRRSANSLDRLGEAAPMKKRGGWPAALAKYRRVEQILLLRVCRLWRVRRGSALLASLVCAI
jgi:hypothetical protein